MRERIFTILAVMAVAFGIVLYQQPAPEATAQGSTFYFEGALDSANVITIDEAATGITGMAEATLIGAVLTCVEDSGTASLDAAVQRSLDGGTTWADIIAFTQLTGTGAETKLYADVRAASAQMIGDRLRAEYDMTGTGQYTCSMALTAEG